MQTFKPIKRVYLYEQVIETLLDMMLKDGLQVGDRLLPEAKIATKFGVSRSSVREGLKFLTVAGMVESLPGKGTFLKQDVKDFTQYSDVIKSLILGESLSEVMEIRKILEVEAAGLAAKRVFEDEVNELQEALEELKKSFAEQEDAVETGEQFHFKIAKIAGNNLLLKITNFIREDIKEYRLFLKDNPILAAKQPEEHEKIFLAIREGDSQLAKNAMRDHLEFLEKQLRIYLGVK